eukprot:gb/GECH01011204.1/.p1 GENE.gb/GECH01011204.1/~~gb/GECH01011204.1/.p1  ORF type:complete len:165 (+),score=13.99 gb/GECH01011204.1/:1-495(+)
MPHSHGYRARTRDLFARPFRHHGTLNLSQYLTPYKLGDYVDIKANGAVQKGMPFKFYHGRTGRVWNVTPRAVGVEVNKKVGNRVIKKRIHVRVEHVKPSRCQEDYIKRRTTNAIRRKLREKYGNKASLKPVKRQAAQPRPGHLVKTKKAKSEQWVAPRPYVELY